MVRRCSLSITIAAAFAFNTTSPLPPAMAGVNYQSYFQRDRRHLLPYIFSSVNLPSGIADHHQRRVDRHARPAGNYNFKVVGDGFQGESGQRRFRADGDARAGVQHIRRRCPQAPRVRRIRRPFRWRRDNAVHVIRSRPTRRRRGCSSAKTGIISGTPTTTGLTPSRCR